jgi:hypothetical protein
VVVLAGWQAQQLATLPSEHRIVIEKRRFMETIYMQLIRAKESQEVAGTPRTGSRTSIGSIPSGDPAAKIRTSSVPWQAIIDYLPGARYPEQYLACRIRYQLRSDRAIQLREALHGSRAAQLYAALPCFVLDALRSSLFGG